MGVGEGVVTVLRCPGNFSIRGTSGFLPSKPPDALKFRQLIVCVSMTIAEEDHPSKRTS